MSTSVKFMFDECLGEPMMEKLRQIVPGTRHFAHVVSYFRRGVTDDVWIPELAKEGGWVIVSGDRGRGSAKGGKLPLLCMQYKITHVLLSATLQNKKAHERLAALALV